MRCIAVFVLALTTIGGARAAEQSPSAFCYEYLLASWTPRVAVEPIVDGISADPVMGNQASLDQVAEFLLQHLDDLKLSKDDVKKTLGLLTRTRSGRYRTVMESVRNASLPMELKDMAREYVADTKARMVEQYHPGSVDLAALRERFVTAALAAQPSDARAHALDSLQPGDPMEKLFALLGPPQHVDARSYLVSKTLNYRRLLLYYRGAGRAVFALDDEKGWRFQATVADPLAFEPSMPYRTRAAEFGLPDDAYIRMAQISSAGVPAIRRAVEESYRLDQVPVDFLDAAAEVLARDWPNSNDELREDNCAWILRLLRTKGGIRYAGVLDEVATKSHSLKLKKWAGLTLGKVAGIPRTPYVIGSKPLAEWAQRFPSPYPGVTYVNGRL